MRAPASLLYALGLLAACSFAPVARAGVLISELCDPRNHYTTDRFIEIANAGNTAVDLTNWSLVAVANGVDVLAWPLSGVIGPGQALVAGNSTTVTGFTVDFPGPWSSNNGNWNGKVGDGAKLLDSGGSIVDYVVATGTTFENADYVRNQGIHEPNPVYTPSEWTATPILLATDASPGTHDAEPLPAGPIISEIVTVPTVPAAGAPVDVRASVFDTAAIVTVDLHWGTTPSPLPNQISMSLLSGDTYATSAPIPGPPESTTVYYRIEATNSTPVTTTSDVLSYFLHVTATTHDIQGEAPTSPFDGLGVITRGTVTASYGSYFVVQDGSGPWSGLWVKSTAGPSVADSVTVRGLVTENDALGFAGNTLLTNGEVIETSPGTLPPSVGISTADVSSESYEGVLVTVGSAVCTNPELGMGEWQLNDGTGDARVGDQGYAFIPTLGTSYAVTGPVSFSDNTFKIEPRSGGDVVWVGDLFAPVVLAIGQVSQTTLLVTFSEAVEITSAETPGHYTLAGLPASAAARDPINPDQVLITVTGVPVGSDTLVVNGVEDLYGNVTAGATGMFQYIDTQVPPGYYDSALGLLGTQLRATLHDIIKNHTSVGYGQAWTAFQTTDVKPNGKVWDIYSDIPGGIPPYEYTFDQTGGPGGQEGNGYSREHTWPKSWFGGEIAPMYSDLWILYPCDVHINGQRGVYPYGEAATPTFTSLNGSQVGTSVDPGYSGTVFEPIDAFKGDLARSYFYVSTRYYQEDVGWPGSPATSGADLLPWANSLFLQWHLDDPVSQKEILRNGAIYALQNNRNPFVDHPDLAVYLFDSVSVVGVESGRVASLRLHQNTPNPFSPTTTIRFDLAQSSQVKLEIFDLLGRRVRTLVGGDLMAPGAHSIVWDGRNESQRVAVPGLYFYRLRAGAFMATMRMVRVR